LALIVLKGLNFVMSDREDEVKGIRREATVPDVRVSGDDDFVGDVFEKTPPSHSFEKIEKLAQEAQGRNPFRSMSKEIDDLDDLEDFGFVERESQFSPRRPKVAVVRLDPAKVYPKKKGESERPALNTADSPFGETVEVLSEKGRKGLHRGEIRPAKVKPVRLNPEKVYPKRKMPEAAEKLREFAESKPVTMPDIAADEIEVLGPEKANERSLSKSPGEQNRKVSKWAFWKKPSKRDEQLARISDGYLEMVDLVRAIRGQLESQNDNNVILRDSLAHLPEAMKGLDSFSKSQHTVGEALQEIHGQMQKYSTKDEKLADSMDGFNSTLKGMDNTTKATMEIFDRVQERMRDSDIRMEHLVENVQSTEEKVSDTMMRLQRNMVIMQTLFLICLMVAIGALIFTFMMNRDGEKAPVNEPVKAEQTSDAEVKPVQVKPREAREIVLPE